MLPLQAVFQGPSRTEDEEAVAELFDSDLRPLVTRFFSCNHLFPTLPLILCCCCRQPDSVLQLALVVVVVVDRLDEDDTAVEAEELAPSVP